MVEIGFAQWLGQVKNFDGMTWMILIVLGIMFVAAWLIMIIKTVWWREALRDADVAIGKLEVARSVQDIELIISQLSRAGIAAYYLVDVLKRLLELASVNGGLRHLSSEEFTQLEQMSLQLIDNRMHKETQFIAPMGVLMVVSPLIGLFGTVWGLINSFLGIAQFRSADISAVAPGIAQGLMATVAGLMVAIPSAVFLFLMQQQVRSLEDKLTTISSQCMWIIHRQLVSKGLL